MVVPFSRPDPSSAAAIAEASFGTARRGYDPSEVRDFLRMVAAELARLQERERFLEREVIEARRPRAIDISDIDEDTFTTVVGEETTRVLRTARESATQIRARADEAAERLLREAQEEAARLRAEAELEAARSRETTTRESTAELEAARREGRQMVEEAREYRERVIADLNRRREASRQQLTQLATGRDRIIGAFDRARMAANDVIAEMQGLGDEADELPPTSSVTNSTLSARRPTPDARHGADVEESVAVPYDDQMDALFVADPQTAESASASESDLAEIAAPGPVIDVAPAEPESDPHEPRDAEVERRWPAISGQTLTIIDDNDPTITADESLDDDLNADAGRSPLISSPGEVGPPADIGAPPDADLLNHGDDARFVDVDIDDLSFAGSDVGDEDDDRTLAPVVELFGSSLAGIRTAERVDRPASDGLAAADDAVQDDVVNDQVVDDGVVPWAPDIPTGGVDATADDADAGEDTPLDGAEVVGAVSGESVSASRPCVAADEEPVPTASEVDATPAPQPIRKSAQDVFARLRSASPDAVAEAVNAGAAGGTIPTIDQSSGAEGSAEPDDATRPLTAIRASAAAHEPAGDPIAARDERLGQVIVEIARRLKRSLADEQNDVLDLLRRSDSVTSLDELLPSNLEQVAEYSDAVRDSLHAAALAGSATTSSDPEPRRTRRIFDSGAVDAVLIAITTDFIEPLRERLDRATRHAEGDSADIAAHARGIYREWKSQRLDDLAIDLACRAYARGAAAVVVPGAPVRWVADSQGVACPDLPDDGITAGRHIGCRCLLVAGR